MILKYIHFQAENAYVFYTQFYKYKESCHFENTVKGLWSDKVGEFLINRKEPNIWLIFSHFKEAEIDKVLSEFNNQLIIKDRFQKTGASCYLLKRKTLE